MTKQEEIRKGIAIILESAGANKEWTLNILEFLHSQGVVLKVEREPREPGYMEAPGWKKVGWHSACKAMIRDGYSAWEPLIEEAE